jgi:DNA sulfur modification protein DndE
MIMKTDKLKNIVNRKAKIVLIFVCAFTSLFFYREKPVKIFLIGDSTMANKPLENNNPERGWGQVFNVFLNDNVIISNHAKNGRSTKSFLDQGLWKVVLDSLSEGDYVFIQFGHNDAKKTDSERYAAPFGAYRNNLIKYVNEARVKGAIPILITPVNRRNFDSAGRIIDSHVEYSKSMKEVAKELNVSLLDLHKKSMILFDSLGIEETKKIFLWVNPNEYKQFPEGKKDNTHFTAYGAIQVAKLVIECIKESDLPLKKIIKQ